MTDWIDAHHHLWDLEAVRYPWLMAKGVERFFGDPTPIQRNYLLDEFRSDAEAKGVRASVHIQVGAEDCMAEARWVQKIADANRDWPMAQVVFCDLTAPNLHTQLDAFTQLSTVRGVRQIIGRAPGEDAQTGTNTLLDDPRFLAGLQEVGRRGLSFDLQLIPELYENTALVLAQALETQIAVCHAGSPHDRGADGLKKWAKDLQALSDLPHVSCKLSGLGMFDHSWSAQSIRPIINTCLDQFGMHRVMFGSNFPVDSLYSDYGTLMDAYFGLIPDHAKTAVFCETAKKFYRF